MPRELAEVLAGLKAGFKLGGQVYVRVNLAERYPAGVAVHVQDLASDLVLAPGKLMEAVLSEKAKLSASHGAVVDALFLKHAVIDGVGVGSLIPSERPTLTRGEKRDVLRTQAFGVRAFEMFRSDGGEVEPTYYGWVLPNDALLVVPLSAGMVDVIEKSRRWEAIAEDIAAFEKKLNALGDAIVDLRRALEDLQEASAAAMHEIGIVVALAQYSELLLDQLGEPPQPHPVAEFATFLRLSAIPLFIDRLVRNPVAIAPDAANKRDAAALRILRILDDGDFKQGVHLVLSNMDIVEHRLADRMFQFLAAAADLMSVTAHADAFAESHALPAIRALGAEPLDGFEETIEKMGSKDLARGYRAGLSDLLPDRDTVYKLGVGLSTGAIGTISNLEGPRSVFVAVLFQYQRHVLNRMVANFAGGAGGFTRAINTFVKYFGDISAKQFQLLRHALADATIGKAASSVSFEAALKKAGIRVTRGPFRTRGWRVTFGLLALSTFLLTLSQGEIDGWQGVVSTASAGGTTLVAIADLPAVTNVVQRKLGEKGVAVLTKSSGALAGFLTGVAALSSGIQFIDAIESGASGAELVEGALGTLGSSASFAGWVWCLRAGAFAATGTTLMTAGSILVIAGLGVGLWRAFRSKGPPELVESSLAALEHEDSSVSKAGLQPTIKALRDLAASTTFARLNSSYEAVLRSMGYDAALIEVLVEPA